MERLCLALTVPLVVAAACSGSSNPGSPDPNLTLSARGATLAATVDPRFQSYNVEMVEVTGGTFWASYESGGFQEPREPIDLSSERLRDLARELQPAYMRVSGTWANSTYFDLAGTTDGEPPEGFNGVLTTDQWDGANDFAMDVGADVMISFAVSPGTRDEQGVWTPDQARALLEYSRDRNYPLAAAEFYNEPSIALGIPNHSAAAFARDFGIFSAMVAETLPSMQIVGPSAVDDVTPLLGTPPPIGAEDILAEVSPAFAAFSYHFYPKLSERCGPETPPEESITAEFLSRVDVDASFYEDLRDTYEPGVPIWVTETAQAACGGDRWAKQFIDVFRYLDELGRLAKRGTQVVMHNTLSASDYGLIDEATLQPRPNYWAALLWQRLMGERALALDIENDDEALRFYAHCTKGTSGGSVTYLVLNLSQEETKQIALGNTGSRLYLLTSDGLLSGDAYLNGELLRAEEDGSMPELSSVAFGDASMLPPTSIAFIVDPSAGAEACGK